MGGLVMHPEAGTTHTALANSGLTRYPREPDQGGDRPAKSAVEMNYSSGKSTFGVVHQLPGPIVRFEELEIGQRVIVGQTGWEQVLENNKAGVYIRVCATFAIHYGLSDLYDKSTVR